VLDVMPVVMAVMVVVGRGCERRISAKKQRAERYNDCR
jgi:hypothetical protein